ncbi:hypothetical protein ACWDZ6_21250 [Streptomyces sp. NPDC002926]
MSSSSGTGEATGTKGKDYNLIWYVEAWLSNALRKETYIQDAELFRKAQADSHKGAELGQQLLRTRLPG